MAIKLFGIEIDRRTDILAFAAFLLSLSSIGYHLIGFLRGPSIDLMPPRQVVLYDRTYRGEKFLTFITTMAYTNKGQAGHNGVILKEYMEFNVQKRNYYHDWHKFVSLSIGSEDQENLQVHDKGTVSAFVVNAGSAEVHETFFAARPIRCPADLKDCNPDKNFIKLQKFLNDFEYLLLADSGIEETTIDFSFFSETLNDGEKKAECSALLTTAYLQDLRHTGWTALTCINKKF